MYTLNIYHTYLIQEEKREQIVTLNLILILRPKERSNFSYQA